MPRKYDKYGFNRQYLRRPCTRANPFPHKLPFVDGFSLSALVHKAQSAPPTNSVNMPTANVPAEKRNSDGSVKRMNFGKALQRFGQREVAMLESDVLVVGALGAVIGPAPFSAPIVNKLLGAAAIDAVAAVVVVETGVNLVQMAHDLIHRGPATRSQTNHRGHRFDLMEGLD